MNYPDDNAVILSIIIPIHNAGVFIEQTLTALFKNKLPHVEIIFIFDNCTDDSLLKVENFLKKIEFENYKLVNSNNRSTSKSRNQGIDIASGTYVAFLDHDDIVDSSMYQRLIKYTQETDNVDVVRCGFSTGHNNNVTIYNEILPNRKSYPFRGIFVWNGIFNLGFLNNNKIRFKEGYGEDYEFNLDLLVNSATEGRIVEQSVYYHWRQHEDNLHKKRTAADFFARAEGILCSKEHFFMQNSDIASEFAHWVIDYTNHLATGIHLKDLAKVYCSHKKIHKFLNNGHQALIEDKALREMIKANSESAFLNAASNLQLQPHLKPTNSNRYINTYKHQVYRLKSVWKNTGGGIKFASYTIKRYGPKFTFLQSAEPNQSKLSTQQNKEMINERIAFLDAFDGDKAVFFVFGQEYISGGLISIYSIANELRSHGIEPIMVAAPGPVQPRNKLFPNQEIVIPWSEFVKKHWNNIKYFMIPEVKVPEFSELIEKSNLSYSNSTLNILNQNIELMPEIKTFKYLYNAFKKITMTTAHERYTSQEVSNKYNTPITHLSTYLSYRDYMIRPFDEKRDLILYSVDDHPLKSRIIDSLWKKNSDYEHKIVKGLTYSSYIELAHAAKFSFSFGEGLDNYFIEAFFTGGIGITVYNPEFMPAIFLSLDNVFSSYPEMEREAAFLIEKLKKDHSYRKTLWEKNFSILSKLYDDRIYKQKLKNYLCGFVDFTPKNMN